MSYEWLCNFGHNEVKRSQGKVVTRLNMAKKGEGICMDSLPLTFV